jgi:FkbM family methyltransferase
VDSVSGGFIRHIVLMLLQETCTYRYPAESVQSRLPAVGRLFEDKPGPLVKIVFRNQKENKMNKRLYDKFISIIFSRLPPRDSTVYKYCHRYVDAYNGENNSDIQTNGELRLLHEYLPKAEVVFDVGANIGLWAKLALEINPSISLHCFEPSLPTFNKLLNNKFPPNIVCNHFGLSSSQRKAELLIFDEGSGMNSLYRRTGLEDGWNIPTQSKSEIIELRTLDGYCDEMRIERIDFAKVDIEGHELEFFHGAKKLLAHRQIKLIQFEYGGTNIDARTLLKDIFELFKEYPEYQFYKILSDSLRLVERYDQRLENFQYQNWAIICAS